MTPVATAPPAALLDRIRTLLGPEGTLESPESIAPYLTDFRGLYHGATPLVACPNETAQVAAVLAACNEAGVGVVPQGGNTSYCGGATPSPDGRQVVLSLHRMNRVRAIDVQNDSIVVEAGCVLAQVQKAARDADRLFPLSLGSEGSCQIGGNLSTNAGGLAAVRYGVARDLVLGLEVVLADGRVLEGLSSLRKDNTGYDLRHLFIGAEGTLGIITAASLKLFPLPRTVETAFVSLAQPSVPAGLERAARLGYRRVVVLPWFLFAGVLPDRIVAQSGEWAAAHPDVEVRTAGLLGPGDELHEGHDARDADDLEEGDEDGTGQRQHEAASGRRREEHGDPCRDTEHVRPPGGEQGVAPEAPVYDRCDGRDPRLESSASVPTPTLVRWQTSRSGCSTPAMAGSP